MAGPNQKPLPPDVIGRADATEVLRAFVVDGGLSIAFQRAFEEPEMWGLLLVDIARPATRPALRRARGSTARKRRGSASSRCSKPRSIDRPIPAQRRPARSKVTDN